MSCFPPQSYEGGKQKKLLVLVQITLSIQSSHTAGACRGNGLTIDMVSNITCSKHPFNTGHGGIAFRAFPGFDIAMIHFQLAFKHGSIGFMANGYKYPHGFNFLSGTIYSTFNAGTGYAGIITKNFIYLSIPLDIDIAGFGFFNQLISQDFF